MTKPKTLFYIGSCVAWAFAFLISSPTHAADVKDSLDPVNFEANLDYRQLLHTELLPTLANYGRMIVMPSSGEGELSVAIYSDAATADGPNATVTLTKADNNLWYANFSDGKARSQSKVKVHRVDASLPKPVAIALSKAWLEMLRRVAPPGQDSPRFFDATEVEFALINGEGEARYGQLPQGKLGKHVEALYNLGKLLIKYCQSEDGERPALARQLESDATSLVCELLAKEVDG